MIKSIEELIKAAGQGDHEKKYGSNMEVVEKANENVSSSTNSDWYDANGVVNSIKDFTIKNGEEMGLFSAGFEGDALPPSYPIPYDITQYKMKKKTEWVDEARPSFDNKPVTSNKATLAQKDLIVQFGVTDKMVKHSTDQQLYDYIVKRAGESADRSMVNMIINGDITTAATGNVNSDDQAPATTFDDGANDDSLLLNGLRYAAIANANTYDVSTFDADDIMAVRKLLATRYKDKLSELAILWNPDAWLTALTDDAIKLAINTGRPATIDNGMRDSLWGMKSASSDLMRLTEADGKESGATPANNTLGQFLVVYTPAVRWGFGEAAKTEVERVQGYGYEITVTMEFGFVVLDAANTVAQGRNMTV